MWFHVSKRLGLETLDLSKMNLELSSDDEDEDGAVEAIGTLTKQFRYELRDEHPWLL
jgi:hypothetical protein